MAKTSWQNQQLEALYRQPLRVKCAIALLLGCLELLAGYHLGLSQLRVRLLQAQQTQQLAASELKQARVQLAQLQQWQTRFTAWQQRAARDLQPLNQPLNTSQLLQRLSLQAEQVGVELHLLTPAAPQQVGGFTKQTVQLRATASYAALLHFVAHLAQAPAVLQLSRLTLTGNQEQPLLTADLTIAAYAFAPVTDIGRQPLAVNKRLALLPLRDLSLSPTWQGSIPINVHDPFTPTLASGDKPCSAGHPLACFPAFKYQVLGTVWQGTKRWAIVRDPQGGVHSVTKGMPLGNRQGQIVHIDEQTVTVLEQGAKTKQLAVVQQGIS